MHASDETKVLKEATQEFIDSTENAVASGYFPLDAYYDLRFRMLLNSREDLKPGDAYGEIFPWQGRFRAPGETQKYGTPTVWLLSSRGQVLEPPFAGNLYHSDPFQITYTVVDLDNAIRKHLKK